MARFLPFLLRLLAPVIAWVVVQVIARIPAWPFLALTSARTALGRSASVALLLAGVLGIATVLSLSYGTWLLIAAIIMAAVPAVGCGIAFVTFGWPAALGGALVGMGLVLAWLPRISPWAVRIDGESAQVPILTVGGFGFIALAYLSTAITVQALQALESPQRHAGHPRKGGSEPSRAHERRRRSEKNRGRK